MGILKFTFRAGTIAALASSGLAALVAWAAWDAFRVVSVLVITGFGVTALGFCGFALVNRGADSLKYVVEAIVSIQDTLRQGRVAEAEAESRQRIVRADADERELKVHAIRALLPAIGRQLHDNRTLVKEFLGIKAESYPAPIIKEAMRQLPDAQPELAGPVIPEMVNFENLIANKPNTIRKLLLGVGPGEQPLYGDMSQLFHVLICGSTRWGKSIFLQMLLYQILTAREKVDIRLADYSGNTFVDFGLPAAKTKDEIESSLSELWTEVNRRETLFTTGDRSYRTLEQFNAMTGSELPYVFFMADEMTGLLDRHNRLEYSDTIYSNIARIGQRAAKYGVYLVLSGQDAKSEILPTTARNQFLSRFQFKAMDRHQARVLIPDCNAHEIQNKGRAYALINEIGQTMEIQTPYIEQETILNLRPSVLEGQVITPAQTKLVSDGGSQIDPYEMLICEKYEQGASLSDCYRLKHRLENGSEMEYSPNGRQRGQIKDILAQHDISLREGD